MVRASADVIKVVASPSMTQPGATEIQSLAADELLAIVEEANRLRRKVMVHAHGARAAEAAARAGAASIEHGTALDERAVAVMAEHGTFFVPTLLTTHGAADAQAAGIAYGPTKSDAELAEEVALHQHSVRLAIDAGIPIAMGTDCPVCPYDWALRELGYLAEAGLGAAGALRAATFDAARLLGIADDAGELVPGKRADVVAVQGDPRDLTGLDERIAGVWLAGASMTGPIAGS
ncbi:MAG: amidohydrolase family protein [Sciscionella sp.]|nr:amidohydrolase family protein [Sciscionella sp.]